MEHCLKNNEIPLIEPFHFVFHFFSKSGTWYKSGTKTAQTNLFKYQKYIEKYRKIEYNSNSDRKGAIPTQYE